MEKLEVILTIVGMSGTFIVSFALFVWWVSTKFYGLLHSMNTGFFQLKEQITTKMTEMHNQNVNRFHSIENRLTQVERRRNHGV